MKILMVYPEFPETYWSFSNALSFEGKESMFPPLGLLTVASMLPNEWERRLVDMNVIGLVDADLEWADMVFASAMLVQQQSLRDVVARAKSLGKTVVVGGPFVSTSSDQIPLADHIFIGEAEETFPQFVKDLELGIPERIYEAAEKPSMALTPLPDFSLCDLSAYSAMCVQYSRGCPFNCEFCDIIEIYGRVPRTKSNEQMIAEFDSLYDQGWRGMVFIVDDNFIGNKKNARKLVPAMAEWSAEHAHPFSFLTEASVNLADDDALLSEMRRANFHRVFLGIETPVKASLVEAQKGQNTKGSLLDSVRKIQSYGMEVMGGFIVGFDSDPEDIFDLQIDFIRDSAIPLAMVGLLGALPDTQLWKRLSKEGRLLHAPTGDNTDCVLTFIPKMKVETLIEGYKKVISAIYSPSAFYARATECLSRLSLNAPEPRRMSLGKELATFARLVLELGVKDSARGEFWRYFGKVLTTNRKRFTHAMTLAAMGYHLRKLTAKYCGEAAVMGEQIGEAQAAGQLAA
jgi:radical SAM superfamily enzyme YgiQ (UPF0313 family)